MQTLNRPNVPSSVLSVALLILSAAWFIGFREFFVANRQSKDGWSSTPIFWLSVLLLVPIISFFGAPLLIWVSRREHQPLTALDYCSVVVAYAPVAIIAFLFLMFVTR